MAKLKGKMKNQAAGQKSAGRFTFNKVAKGKTHRLTRKKPSKSESGKDGLGKKKRLKQSGKVGLTSSKPQENQMIIQKKRSKRPQKINSLEPVGKMKSGKNIKIKSSLTKIKRHQRNILEKNGAAFPEQERNEFNSMVVKTPSIGFKKLMCKMRRLKKTWRDLKEQPRKRCNPLIQYAENDGSEISPQKVSEAVKAVLQIIEDKEKETKLLGDESKDIYLQITSFKIPNTSPRDIRIVLPHSLLPSQPDVCLFTSDLEKGKRIDHESTLEHFRNLLSEKGVTQITEVITVRQLKTEYDQYELKRALCNRFDVFLSEAKVSGHITHLLGKIFHDRKKIPVPIKLDTVNLKECVETCLHKSSFRVSGSGTVSSLKVAHTLLTLEQIQENIMAAINALHKCFPGGWDNILQLMIKGSKSIPVPFYLSTKNDNRVTSYGTPLRPKAARCFTGELPGVGIVRVHPDGEVVVHREEKDDELEVAVDETEREAQRARAQENWNRKRKAKNQLSKDDDIDEEYLLRFAKQSRLQSEEDENEVFDESEDVMEEDIGVSKNKYIKKDGCDDDDDDGGGDDDCGNDDDIDVNDTENPDKLTKIDTKFGKSIGTIESKYLHSWAMTRIVGKEEEGEKQKDRVSGKKNKSKTGRKQKHGDNEEKMRKIK